MIPYEDEEDAIRIANDSPYGLAGNVMSSSLERSLAVARRLRAGFIGLNGTAGYGADTPVRRLQEQRCRAPERHGRIRAVHRNQVRRLPGDDRGERSMETAF